MATANDTPLRIENQIAAELDGINLAISQTDLHEQEGAAEKLPHILELTKSLAHEIDELGSFEQPAERRPGANEVRLLVERVDACEEPRQAAQDLCYRVQGLLGAALELIGDEDPQIEEVVRSAAEHVKKLANDLDSVRFGKGGAA